MVPLGDVMSQYKAHRRTRSEELSQLEAMLPAILDWTFRGQLS